MGKVLLRKHGLVELLVHDALYRVLYVYLDLTAEQLFEDSHHSVLLCCGLPMVGKSHFIQ